MLYALLASLPWAATVAYLIHTNAVSAAGFRRERHEWATERQSLLDRIQAPQQEIAAQVAERHRSDEPLYVDFDDDDEFWKAKAS